jgi:hypothetical protein
MYDQTNPAVTTPEQDQFDRDREKQSALKTITLQFDTLTATRLQSFLEYSLEMLIGDGECERVARKINQELKDALLEV